MADAPWRRDTLGSSDAAALAGCDPFRNAADVWAEKTGRLAAEPERGPGGLDPRALGSAIEPVLLDAVAERLGTPLAVQVFYRHPTFPLAASIDGLVTTRDPAILVEAKTAGLAGAPGPLLAAYGDDGTDAVPDSVAIQLHHQFAVLDAQPDVPHVALALVPALLGGRGYRCYVVRRNDALVAELLAMEVDWWRTYVEGNRCPPPEPPSFPVLRAFRRRPDAPPVPVDAAMVAGWVAARDALRAAKKAEEVWKRRILLALDDAEVGVCALGRVSYRPSAREEYTVPAQTVRTFRFTATRPAGATEAVDDE